MQGLPRRRQTATAQKVDPRREVPEIYPRPFVGFVPAEKPRLVVAVVLDDPMIGHYGGDLAGPVFRRGRRPRSVTSAFRPRNVKPAVKRVKAADADPPLVAAPTPPPKPEPPAPPVPIARRSRAR